LLARAQWHYLGIDLDPGPNVNIVLGDPYRWHQIKPASVDVIVSGQTFEHAEFFWPTRREIARALKPDFVAPSAGE